MGKLDFRVVAEWPFSDEQLAYLAPPCDDHFWIEVLAGGDNLPTKVRPYADLDPRQPTIPYKNRPHTALIVRTLFV